MTTLHRFANIAAITALLTASAVAEPLEKRVAFKTTTDQPQRYVTSAAKGALDTSGLAITTRQIFTLIDANGGDLADGDEVQIKRPAEGTVKESYWCENGESVSRFPREKATGKNFKIKKTDKGLSLQTESGKFVVVTSKGAPLTVSDAADKAAVFEMVENPVAPEAAATPATSATPAAHPSAEAPAASPAGL